MKSAFECFHEVAQCEQLARVATSDDERVNLLAKAKQWRTLAEEAQKRDSREVQALRELS